MCLLFILFLMQTPGRLWAEDESFMLVFRHTAVEKCYVSAIYSEDQVYLSMGELFSLLCIYYEQENQGRILFGRFPEDCQWEILVDDMIFRMDRDVFSLAEDDFRMGKMDMYLTPAVFSQLFGLHFTINLSTLNLTLESDHILPVEERERSKRLRRQLGSSRSDSLEYPMHHPRDRRMAGAGMVDYRLGAILGNSSRNLNYGVTGSMELLGGDIRGAIHGLQRATGHYLDLSDFQWRWVLPRNPLLTSIRAGQIMTTGITAKQITGCAVTNDPVMPRKTCGVHVVDGHTVPESDVELFVNHRLIDFVRADELGYYRFDIPLNYGTMRVSIHIYTPDGRTYTREKQMQVPYSFLPRGVMSYRLQGGFESADASPLQERKQVVHGDLGWGIFRGLTARIGADYLGPHATPLYYGSFSSRLFQQYLFNIDIAPGVCCRVDGGVTYPDNKSFRFSWTRSSGTGWNQYLPAGSGLTAGIYFPVKMAGLNHGFRMWGTRQTFANDRSSETYRAGYNTRMGRTDLRLNYTEHRYTRSYGLSPVRHALASAAVACNLPRDRRFPGILNGMFVRLQVQYDMHRNEWHSSGIQLSQSLGRHSRFQLNADYSHSGRSMGLQGTVTVDLPFIRSSTRFNWSDSRHQLSQLVSGSLAYDSDRGYLSAGNRSMAGQCGVSIRMFIDSDGNGVLNTGEQIIPARAVRIHGGGTLLPCRDSLLRITRLHNYWTYQVEVVQNALPDPTLAPQQSRFSFQADPNRFKPIDIPLYRTGVIAGYVTIRTASGETDGLGGIRLHLKEKGREEKRIIRSFTDGGFYAMNLLPGKYTLEVDPVQLGFLNAQSIPQRLEFEIRSLAGGDLIEHLKFRLDILHHEK